MGVAIGIGQYLKIIVVVNRRIPARSACPDMRFLNVGAQVEELVIPHKLDARAQTRRGSLCAPLNAGEVFRPLSPLPGRPPPAGHLPRQRQFS